MKTFIDLHGVLADFLTPLEKLFGVEIDCQGVWSAPIDNLPNFASVVSAQNSEWWATLPVYKDAYSLIAQYKPDAIVSTLWGNTAAYEGTSLLLKEHFPHIPVIFTPHKYLLAKGNRLIDDKAETINAWRVSGGVGILYDKWLYK